MKKADWILIITGLLIALAFVLFLLTQKNSGYANVYYDGDLIETINLNIDKTYTYQFEENTNIVSVNNGQIAVIESNCPNKDCINMGYISKNKQVIVCLPHKFSISVVNKNDDYDFVIE
ncbi:MAG: NusG domain II-containing protein [Lachnospiraceae bacterium]|nr:NusG domain II-containing protein [Lachnospiraceae bacterium]